MKNYKKISLLLLLSTALTINAFVTENSGPFDDDLDNMPKWNGRSYRKTALEQEAEKHQKPVAKKPTAQPIPVPQPTQEEPNLYKQQEEVTRKAKEAVQAEQTITRLMSELVNLCEEIEIKNTHLQKERDAEITYDNALKEIAEKRSLNNYEKLGMGIAVIAGTATIITETLEDVPTYAIIAIVSALGTACSCELRHRSCNREEQELMTTHEIELEQATKTTYAAVRKKEQIIKEAEAKLALLKVISLPNRQGAIAHFEDSLKELKNFC